MCKNSRPLIVSDRIKNLGLMSNFKFKREKQRKPSHPGEVTLTMFNMMNQILDRLPFHLQAGA